MQKVILTGIKPNENSDVSYVNLATLFKTTPVLVKQMLGQGQYQLKRGLTDDIAMKYRSAIDSAGGTCRIEDDGPIIEPIDVDLPEPIFQSAEAESEYVCGACGAAVSADDQWCIQCGVNVAAIDDELTSEQVRSSGLFPANFQMPEEANRDATRPVAVQKTGESMPGHTTIVVVGTSKSVAAALILGAIFGPLGLLYASVAGGIVMFFVSLIVGVLTLGLGLFVIWPLCALWGAISANSHNRSLIATARPR